MIPSAQERGPEAEQTGKESTYIGVEVVNAQAGARRCG